MNLGVQINSRFFSEAPQRDCLEKPQLEQNHLILLQCSQAQPNISVRQTNVYLQCLVKHPTNLMTAVRHHHFIYFPKIEFLHKSHSTAINRHVKFSSVIQSQDILKILTSTIEIDFIQKRIIMVSNFQNIMCRPCILSQSTCTFETVVW